jgi:transcriptional regulator with XRE-family HTH domain
MAMRIEKQLTPEAVLEELGRRLARRRLDYGITQADVAEQAGLGKRTVERIEAGGDTQVSTLIRLLRVLELVDGLERLVPDTGPRPMELLRLKGKERKRASSKRSVKPGGEWHWGDGE